MPCGSCGGSARAKLQGRVPTASKPYTWVAVMTDGTVAEFDSEIAARAYSVSDGQRGQVVKKKN